MAKIIYSRSTSRQHRYAMHDIIVKKLDAYDEEDDLLSLAIIEACAPLRESGIIDKIFKLSNED